MRGWFLILLITVAGTVAAQTTSMYRTLGADGTVTFSDMPLNETSERINVLVRSGTATQAARQSGPETETTGDEPADSRAAEIAANCKSAREQQQGLQNSNRLYRVVADGSREFLSDEEVVAAREHAAAEVSRWCTSE